MIANELQNRLQIWLNHNFPNTTSDQQFKGVVEELGELSHADLKGEQGIRGYDKTKTEEEIKDAVGDLVIYLCNYCTTKNINFKECVDIAFSEVIGRDWIKYPKNGVKEDDIYCDGCKWLNPTEEEQNREPPNTPGWHFTHFCTKILRNHIRVFHLEPGRKNHHPRILKSDHCPGKE